MFLCADIGSGRVSLEEELEEERCIEIEEKREEEGERMRERWNEGESAYNHCVDLHCGWSSGSDARWPINGMQPSTTLYTIASFIRIHSVYSKHN